MPLTLNSTEFFGPHAIPRLVIAVLELRKWRLREVNILSKATQ